MTDDNDLQARREELDHAISSGSIGDLVLAVARARAALTTIDGRTPTAERVAKLGQPIVDAAMSSPWYCMGSGVSIPALRSLVAEVDCAMPGDKPVGLAIYGSPAMVGYTQGAQHDEWWAEFQAVSAAATQGRWLSEVSDEPDEPAYIATDPDDRLVLATPGNHGGLVPTDQARWEHDARLACLAVNHLRDHEPANIGDADLIKVRGLPWNNVLVIVADDGDTQRVAVFTDMSVAP